ncbi:MAG: glucose-1-phosphate thymidylyltransferase [Candidatus Brocadiia bacterium]
MKALIAAGGKGTRLRPITHTRNKHLIPIANKPILHYALEYVAAAGIREAGIIVNADSNEVQEALGSGERWGLKITYIPQTAPLGLAHCVKIGQPFIGREPFVFYLGDNMVVGGIERFRDEFLARKSNCHLALARVHDPERFGVPEIAGDRIISIQEKPKAPKSQFAVTGIYFYDESVFEAVHHIQPSARGELEISDAHDYLIKHGKRVTFSEITGWWKDTGLPDDLLEANRLVLDHAEPAQAEGVRIEGGSQVVGRVILQRGARIVGSNIRGPAIIGENTVIENSYIGPYTSIYHDCQVTRSEVEFSIVLANCRIENIGVRIEGSLLGCDSQLIRARDKPRTHRFVVGDQGIIEIA